MTDGEAMPLFAALSTGFAVALSLLFRSRRPSWSRSKGSLIAAAPLPGAVALLCLWVFGKAIVATLFAPATCGVDACGMAMAFSLIVVGWALVAYVIAAFAAFLAFRRKR